MKKRVLTIKFTYNGIQIIKNNHIHYYNLEKAVENNKVINSDLFIEKLSNIIDNLKINNSIFSDNINIIIDSTYNLEELKLINTIFKELSFNKITFTNILELLNITNQELCIELNHNNFKIYYLNNTYEGYIYFNKPLPIIDTYLKYIIKNNNINNIYIFGESEKIYRLISYIEKKYHIQTYYYSHPKLYPLTELID